MSKINDYLKTAIFAMIIVLIAPSTISHIQYQWASNLESRNKIGHICINGPINSSSTYRKYLIQYFKDNSIKAILLKIESSGGAPGSCQALAFDIESLKKEFPKPIITYTENMCCAGAYEIATATDHIVTAGSAVIGDIGTSITTIYQVEEFLKLHNETTKKPTNIASEEAASAIQTSVNPFTNMTKEQRAMLQSVADNSYQQLAKEIASKRHLQLNKIDQWGGGKLFTGQQAYDLKLVDALGSKRTAINLIKKNIIPSDRMIEWVTPPAQSIFKVLWTSCCEHKEEDLDTLQ